MVFLLAAPSQDVFLTTSSHPIVGQGVSIFLVHYSMITLKKKCLKVSRGKHSLFEDDLEEDPDAAGAEAVNARLDERLLQEALLVGRTYLEKRNIEDKQCDQMLELKVAQMFPKVAQKVAKAIYSYK